LDPIVEKWRKALDVQLVEYRIKRMKTKWGTSNARSRRIWVNLELIKKPVDCLKYVVVHELVHLIERKHNERFIAMLDEHLPHWRSVREMLNSAPLAHEAWTY
jgi:predicted metal-dependent hydrolase